MAQLPSLDANLEQRVRRARRAGNVTRPIGFGDHNPGGSHRNFIKTLIKFNNIKYFYYIYIYYVYKIDSQLRASIWVLFFLLRYLIKRNKGKIFRFGRFFRSSPQARYYRSKEHAKDTCRSNSRPPEAINLCLKDTKNV